jgi:Na+/melibiose symporter-like transporter
LIGPLPAVLILLGNLALMFYPLNQKHYEQVQAAILEKEKMQV